MRKAFTTLAVLIGLSLTGLSIGQEPRNSPIGSEPDKASRLDTVTEGSMVRASKLMGMNIQNSAGENVGKINDIVLDAQRGKVNYVAVTYGGFLGIGNKMFAVPFAAFKIRPNPSDRSQTVLMLDVTQKQMEGAVGFDEDHWPDFSDKKFQTELYDRYKVKRDAGVKIDADRDGVNIDVNRGK